MKDTTQLIDVVALSKKNCVASIECKLAYATSENFLGRIVEGYHSNAQNFCMMVPKAAIALCEVQNQLYKQQLGLFIFDGYRPLRAVKDFGKWMRQPAANAYELERKAIHYPHIEKYQLADLGYVCDKVSNHCYGDTVDLTLIDLTSKEILDMGACFDYFDEISHITATSQSIGDKAYKNRQLLSEAMQAAGFQPYEKEYWHFTYHERCVTDPFDIEITNALAGQI